MSRLSRTSWNTSLPQLNLPNVQTALCVFKQLQLHCNRSFPHLFSLSSSEQITHMNSLLGDNGVFRDTSESDVSLLCNVWCRCFVRTCSAWATTTVHMPVICCVPYNFKTIPGYRHTLWGNEFIMRLMLVERNENAERHQLGWSERWKRDVDKDDVSRQTPGLVAGYVSICNYHVGWELDAGMKAVSLVVAGQ